MSLHTCISRNTFYFIRALVVTRSTSYVHYSNTLYFTLALVVTRSTSYLH